MGKIFTYILLKYVNYKTKYQVIIFKFQAKFKVQVKV